MSRDPQGNFVALAAFAAGCLLIGGLVGAGLATDDLPAWAAHNTGALIGAAATMLAAAAAFAVAAYTIRPVFGQLAELRRQSSVARAVLVADRIRAMSEFSKLVNTGLNSTDPAERIPPYLEYDYSENITTVTALNDFMTALSRTDNIIIDYLNTIPHPEMDKKIAIARNHVKDLNKIIFEIFIKSEPDEDVLIDILCIARITEIRMEIRSSLNEMLRILHAEIEALRRNLAELDGAASRPI